MSLLELIFWISLFIVFYTYLGYGIILYLIVLVKECLIKHKSDIAIVDKYPDVTLLIPAYNEEAVIVDKMLNTKQIEYPGDKLNVVWVTDGSTDSTNEILSSYSDVKVLFDSKRSGKTAAINRVVPLIDTSLIIFTDANTMLNKESVYEIVRAFDDKKVGCVAGEKRILLKGKESASSGGEGIYWRYESFLKSLDSRLYSAVGAAGELFAIRRNLYETIEKDSLLDDFVLSMRITQKGYKIKYCKSAYAIEEGSLNMEEEKKRKIRIAAGGLQSVIRLYPLLNIFKYGTLSFQYISHRVLRWTVTPFLLISLLPLNIALTVIKGGGLFSTLLVLQILFYIFGLLGKHLEDRKLRNKFLFIPYYFLFMNLNVFLGINYLMKKKGDGTWEKSMRK